MSTIILYRNSLDVEITLQQKSQLNQYQEMTYVDGRLKKEVHYFENQVEYTTLYVYPDEDLTTNLNGLTQPNFTYSVGKDYYELNGYKVWKFYDYTDGTLDLNYTESVKDSIDREIAYAGYYPNGSIRVGGIKTYYLEGKILYDEDGEIDIAYKESSYILFDFTDGSLKIDVTFDEGDPYKLVYRFVNDWQELLPFMTPEILTYYTNLEPLVPDLDIST